MLFLVTFLKNVLIFVLFLLISVNFLKNNLFFQKFANFSLFSKKKLILVIFLKKIAIFSTIPKYF